MINKLSKQYNVHVACLKMMWWYACIHITCFTSESQYDIVFGCFVYLQEGWTALMAAANNGRYGVVDILLQHGANPDMQDDVSTFFSMPVISKERTPIIIISKLKILQIIMWNIGMA